MNGRSGIFTLGLFLVLAIVILMQWLLMLQSDRLYQRVNRLEQSVAGQRMAFASSGQRQTTAVTDSQAMDGDWLIWQLGTDATTLNPITSNDFAASYILGAIMEPLLERDLDTLEWKPKLAESWEISQDGLEIWFRLRSDVHFSDGEPITADDIVFTLETIKDPCVNGAHLRNYYQDVDYVEKINDREVTFHLSQCYFKSLSICGGMQILPEHIYRYTSGPEFNNAEIPPIGSGPYVFDGWDRGDKIVLRRNENYWGQKPHLERIVYKIITNETAAITALRTGEVDFVAPLPEQYVELSQNEEFAEEFQCLSYWTPGNGYFYIGWNLATPFFADQRVRLAMTLMIDRKAIIEHLLEGVGQVPTGPFSILSPQSDSSIEPWPYDPERAAALLDEAGWVDTNGDGIRDKDGVAFSFKYMIVSGAGLHERMARLVKDAAAGLGIEVTPDPYEWSVFIGRLHERDFQAVNLAWGGSVESDPYQIWHSSQIDGGSNYISFNNPQADQIIEQARRTLDEDARNLLYHQLHLLLHEQQPYTFIYTRPSQRFLDKRFQNVIVHTLGLDPDDWYVPLVQQRY